MTSQQQIAEWPRNRLERSWRRHSQVAYLGNRVVLARVLAKYKMFLSTTDLGFSSHVMLDGYWESWLTRFIARRLQPGMHVIDVGANFGYYSLLMADSIGPTGKLLSVEPVAETAKLLKDSLELNGFWKTSAVCQVALTSAPGSVRMVVPPREPKNAFVVVSDGAQQEGAIEVAATTLDELARPLGNVDFIKIDADGSEEAIVTGMKETIRAHRPALVLEYNPARCKNPDELIGTLLDAYGRARVIGFDAELEEISRSVLCDQSNLEDWLLYFH